MPGKQNQNGTQLPSLYRDLAGWWPLLSAPEDYQDEADFFYKTILELSSTPPKTLLELGSGGGNNAKYLKAHFEMTLVDLSPDMLRVSQRLNPECTHIQGDMRTLGLKTKFDSVFIHDAIMYITNKGDLKKVLFTAFDHCVDEGVVLIVPDFVRETFKEDTQHGGHDGISRSARYLSWTYDPDPNDHTYVMEFCYLLKDEKNVIHKRHDTHTLGLFPQQDWVNLMIDVGFDPEIIVDPYERRIMAGIKCRF